MLGKMRTFAVDAVGNMDRRVTNMHSELCRSVEAALAVVGKAQQAEALMQTCRRHAKQYPTSSGLITRREFVAVLDALKVQGLLDDKHELFERFNSTEQPALAIDVLCKSIFGLARAPFASEPLRRVLKEAAQKMKQRVGESGLRDLTRSLRFIAGGGSNAVNITVLQLGSAMARVGADLPPEDFHTLLQGLCEASDSNQSNSTPAVALAELLRGFRGCFNQRRALVVQEAFHALVQGASSIALGNLVKKFQAARHPAVMKRERSAAEVSREFSMAWDVADTTAVTEDAFVDYYKDISGLVDRDAEFEAIVRGCWGLPEPPATKPPAPGKTVLVTTLDGNQRIAELPDSIAIKADKDYLQAKQWLEKSGGFIEVTGIDPYSF